MGKYFGGFSKDWDELTGGHTSGGTKALAGLKILGKAVANVGTFAVTEVVPGMIESAGKGVEKGLAENRDKMTKEQVDKAEKAIQTGKDVGQRRQEARDIEWQIERKTEELAEQMEKHPAGHPAITELKKEIAQLEAKKPEWYDNKTESKQK